MRTFAALRTVAYIALFLLGWGWVAHAVRGLDPVIGVGLPPWVAAPGYAICGLGVVLLILFTLVLPLRGLGTPAPFDAPRLLIDSGPYRFVRNPIYVAGLVALLGYALAMRSVSVLVLAMAVWALAHALVIFYEEPHLRRVFGASYEHYLSNVNRWLPRRPRGRG